MGGAEYPMMPPNGVKWRSRIKGSICIAALLIGGCETDRGPVVNYDPQSARSKIIAALPAGWSVIPHQDEGMKRKTDGCFTDPRTEAFILVGPQPNYFELTDHQGKTHREYLAKECLYVWITPGEFEPNFGRRTFNNWVDPPWRLRPVFASRGVRVYGDVQHYIADTNRLHQAMSDAHVMSSPGIHLSWGWWRRDIAASLKK